MNALRAFLVLLAGVVGFWAGGLHLGWISLILQISAFCVFLLNIIPLARGFSEKFDRDRPAMVSGDLVPWRPVGLIVFYIGVAIFGSGLFMLLTALRPQGHVIDIGQYLKYGVALTGFGVLTIAIGRFLGRRK